MHPLDDDRRRRRIDKGDALRAFSFLPDQAEQAWRESRRLRLGMRAGVSNVVISGMGGSALGAHVLRSVFRDRLRMPVEILNGYTLPGYVGRKTLVLLSSYSGTTEETLASARDARRRGAALVGIAAGGPLSRLLRSWKVPCYAFDARFNPGNRPRMALGYSLFGILGILSRARALSVTPAEVEGAIRALRSAVRRNGAEAPFAKNPAKKLAAALDGRAAIFVAAEHLEGSAHVLANQTNETGKQFAAWFPLPELNHHLMEGLKHPRETVRSLTFVLLSSRRYHERVQKRVRLTAEVIRKNGARAIIVAARGKSALAEAADLLAFGGAATYWLGIANRENPSPNPWVDYFKKRLG